MDKTETYIKMAECEEIQSRCTFDWNFWAIMRNSAFVTLTCVKGDRATFMNPSFYPVFLPTQSQLLEMAGDDLWDIIERFNWLFIDGLDVGNQDLNDYAHKFTSMEQLWLAFRMKELCNKIWDGEKWIKTTE